MNKEEFLQDLRRDLAEDVSPAVVEENVRYYRQYISDEVRKGRSEEEVIAEIGTPRLIAKNIEDTTEEDERTTYSGGYTDSRYEDAYSDDDRGNIFGDIWEDDRQRERSDDEKRNGGYHVFHLGNYGCLLATIIFIIIFGVVVYVVGGIFRFLAPYLIPILLVWVIFNLIRDSRRR